jgi:hypothetical protein
MRRRELQGGLPGSELIVRRWYDHMGKNILRSIRGSPAAYEHQVLYPLISMSNKMSTQRTDQIWKHSWFLNSTISTWWYQSAVKTGLGPERPRRWTTRHPTLGSVLFVPVGSLRWVSRNSIPTDNGDGRTLINTTDEGRYGKSKRNAWSENTGVIISLLTRRTSTQFSHRPFLITSLCPNKWAIDISWCRTERIMYQIAQQTILRPAWA